MKSHIRVVSLIAGVIILDLQFVYSQGLTDGRNRQDIEKPDSALLFKLTLHRSLSGSAKKSYSTIEGDPFLYMDFAPGKVILNTGENIPLYLRFNIYTHAVQFRYDDKIFALLNEEGVSSVLIDTIRLIYTSYLKSAADINSKANTWFILKKDGKLKLLVMKSLKVQGAESARGYQPPTDPKFIFLPDTYYLKPEGKSAVRVADKKDLLALLADKSSAVIQFMEENRLGVKRVKDLARIVAYYNTLE